MFLSRKLPSTVCLGEDFQVFFGWAGLLSQSGSFRYCIALE